MSTERDETVRRAEGLVRQGRIDAAIAEYDRIVEQFPNDLATANTLGDLYVRVAQSDRALPLFLRIADTYFHDGFFSKAAGFYKKILKFQPQDETTLLRLGAVSLQMGHAAEARGCFLPVLARRRQRRDDRGVDEVLVLLGQATPDDLEARVDGARAALRLQGRAAGVAARETAEVLARRGRRDEAMGMLEAVLAVNPADTVARARLVRWTIDSDQLDRARAVLDAAGVPVDVAFTELRAEIDVIEAARLAEPELAPPAATTLTAPRAATESAAQTTASASSTGGVVGARKTSAAPPAPPAVAASPGRTNVAGAAALPADEVDLTAALNALAAPPAMTVPSPSSSPITHAVAAEGAGAGDDEPMEDVDEEEAGDTAASLDHVFDEARREMAEAARHEGAHLIELAATYEAAGLTDNAIETLAQAARDPRARSEASRRMAAIRQAQGEHAQAVEWLERAVDATDAGSDRDPLLRELARALEAAGEAIRALAVWLEVQTSRPDDDEARAAVARLCRGPFGGGEPSAP